jgi:hypothetical protein
MLQTSRDDLDDNDVMAYSSIGVDNSDEHELESGGAIMDAIEHKDPSKSVKVQKKVKKVAKKVVEKDEESEETSDKNDEEKKPVNVQKTKV